MNIWNLNTLQTVLSAVNAMLIALLTQIGCLPGADGKLVCTVAGIGFLTPVVLGWAAAVSNFLKFVIIPWLQPGGLLNNLFAPKVPVASTGEPGTVTQRQVDSTTAGDPKKA